MRNALTMLLVAMACLGPAMGCAPSRLSAGPRAHVPIETMRRFEVSTERALEATTTALRTFGYEVTIADVEHGIVKTAPKVHRFVMPSSPQAGDYVPLSHAFVLTVRSDGPGRSLLRGHIRTFSGAEETTVIGAPNAPMIEEMWARLFAEIASNLRSLPCPGRGSLSSLRDEAGNR